MHTEGKIKAEGLHIITEDGKRIGQTFMGDLKHDKRGKQIPDLTGPANAARIVKTWNMHDELVAQNEKSLKALEIILQEAERVSMLVNFEHWTAEFRTQWYANTLVAEKEIDDLKSLLQQAKL